MYIRIIFSVYYVYVHCKNTYVRTYVRTYSVRMYQCWDDYMINLLTNQSFVSSLIISNSTRILINIHSCTYCECECDRVCYSTSHFVYILCSSSGEEDPMPVQNSLQEQRERERVRLAEEQERIKKQKAEEENRRFVLSLKCKHCVCHV